MNKRCLYLYISLIFVVILNGCSHSLKYTLSIDKNNQPQTIAVLPVQGSSGEEEEKLILFRDIIIKRLRISGYKPILIASNNEQEKSLESAISRSKSLLKDARIHGADALLYTTITSWNEKLYLYYASLSISAKFELYSINGKKLWTSHYKKSNSGFGLDKKVLKLSVFETYEPLISNLVDYAFSTLPRLKTNKSKRGYFNWLP